ncbi:MAG: tRNA-dihydrouridine synthase [Promethearchaeota archaeon]
MKSKQVEKSSSRIIKLGPLTLNSDLILAPMMDVTTPSYISTCKNFGGLGFYIYPMIFINQIAAAPKTVIPHMEFVEKSRPSAVQICGNGRSIEIIKKAIDILNSYNFDVIDINGGCPARHTCNSGGGASLLKPHRFNDFKNLVHNTIKLSNKPVSVKIRIGWTNKEGLEEICRLVQDEGAIFLTVHGRFASQNYSREVDLNSIKKIKEQMDIPVVGNGDVTNIIAYEIMKKKTNVDAVMIGRASQGNPQIFSEIYYMEKRIQDILKNANCNCDLGNSNDYANYSLGDLIKEYRDFNLPQHSVVSNKINQIMSIPLSKIKELDYYGEWRDYIININTVEKIRKNVNVFLKSIENLSDFWNNERFKLIELRRNIIWMLKGMHNATNIKPKIAKIRDLSELLNYVYGDQFEKDLEIRQ